MRGAAIWAVAAWACASPAGADEGTIPPIPAGHFSPSNARTVDGEPIRSARFIPAARCAGCHADAYHAWSESLHRNAGREPFYKESVDLLSNSRPIEFSRHCEGCHLPVALISGALTTGSREPRPLDDEGVTCSVCHSIVEARTDGTGSYTMAPPALLVGADGRARADASDAEILADVAGHRRAVMRPLLRTPEFCATCHKGSVPIELSGYVFMQKGFNVYDEWQESAFSRETVAPPPAAGRADCRACHMERVAAAHDLGAKRGTLASHRWRGANTAVPLFYGATEQLDLTRAFLQSGVVAADIFSVENLRTGRRLAPLDGRARVPIALAAGDPIQVEVVISAEGIGHSFPPEIRDLYEAWVELRAVDARGREVFRTPGLDPAGRLDPGAHAYRQELVDRGTQPLSRHEVWLAISRACDSKLAAGTPDLMRLRFVLPPGADLSELRLSATVNYRRLNRDYSDYVLARRGARLEIPVVVMAKSEVVLGGAAAPSLPALTPAERAARWRRYGRALGGRGDHLSVAAFAAAAALDPENAELAIDQAAAELRSEKTSPPSVYARRALALLGRADSPRARYFGVLARLALGEIDPAVAELRALTALYPRDRELRRRLGAALYRTQRFAEAEPELRALLAIDPLDADAYQVLSAAAAHEGRPAEARELFNNYWMRSHLATSSVHGACDRTGAEFPQMRSMR